MYPYAFYLTKKVKELTIAFSQFVGNKAEGGVSKQVNLRNRRISETNHAKFSCKFSRTCAY